MSKKKRWQRGLKQQLREMELAQRGEMQRLLVTQRHQIEMAKLHQAHQLELAKHGQQRTLGPAHTKTRLGPQRPLEKS